MWRLRAPLLALLLMQVILLASSGVTATKKPLGKQETCNMKNHMIEYLRNNGVQIYERPQISTQYCKKEWETFGNCCDPEQIRDHVEEKVRLNNLALEAVILEVSSMATKLAQFKHARFLENRGNGISFKTASKKVLPKKEAKEINEKIQEIGKAIIKSQQQQVKNQEKCVAKINSVISKSACSICSGRSDDFFNKQGKLKMSEKLCRSVLNDCSEAWMSMIAMAKDVEDYTRLVRKLNPSQDSDGILEEKGFTMNLDSFITNRNLIPIMNQCSGKSLADCSFEHVAALCEQFIHIQAPTYIESSQSQAQKILTSLKAADQEAKREINLNLKRYQALSDLQRNQTANETFNERERIFQRGARFVERMEKLKNLWIKIQLGVPILQLLSDKSEHFADQTTTQKFQFAIRRAKVILTQIENTIAAAAVLLYRTIREFILRPYSDENKKQAEALWTPIICLVQKIKPPKYSTPEEQALFEKLALVAQDKFRLALKRKNLQNGWLAARKLFMQTVARRIAHILGHQKQKSKADPEIPKVTFPQDAAHPQGPVGRVLTDSMILDPPSEISVVVNPQCNPCVNPEGPGILEEP